ncbi:DUF58 domain-containing protein [Planctomycetota bacterium]
MSKGSENRPPPIITSRRTLLEQSAWFYWFTILIGVIAWWLSHKIRTKFLWYLFLVMAVCCLAIPIFSKLAEYRFLRQILLPRKLKTTREGKWFLILVIAIGFSAINSGDNLLYLILAMMLSFIISSGLMSENVMKGISITRLVPRNIFAGETFRILLKIKNLKKRSCSYSLLFEDPEIEAISLLPTSCYIFRISPGSTETVGYAVNISRRGRFKLNYLEVGTLFPFNFFMKSMERNSRAEVIVFPEIRRLNENYFQVAASQLLHSNRASFKTGRNDFHSLYEYRPGDNPRWIHWKSSARQNKLMVKCFDTDESAHMIIVLNNYISHPRHREAYETAIIFAASVTRYCQNNGFLVKLIHHSQPSVTTGQSRGQDVYQIYKTLAELEPGKTPTAAKAAENISTRLARNALILLLTPEPDDDLTRLATPALPGAAALRYVCVTDKEFGQIMYE